MELFTHLEITTFISCPLSLLVFWRTSIPLAQIHQPLCFRNLGLHLHDQYLQLLLALLAGVGVDVAGMLRPVRPHGRIASLKQVIIEFADAAGAWFPFLPHIGLEVGHTRLFRLGRGSFPPRL